MRGKVLAQGGRPVYHSANVLLARADDQGVHEPVARVDAGPAAVRELRPEEPEQHLRDSEEGGEPELRGEAGVQPGRGADAEHGLQTHDVRGVRQ